MFSVICAVCGVRQRGNKVFIELEDSADVSQHKDRVMWRGLGSELRTLLLYEEEYVDLSFCLSALTLVTISNIRYSNDGLSDHIILLMNNRTIAEFETIYRTNWGHMWNVFSDTRQVTDPILLSPGYHTLRILVYLSDNYGTELDSLELQLENQPSFETFFCTKALTEHVVFSKLPFPKIDPQRIETVGLITNIEPYECIDKYNVFMCLETDYFVGMKLYAHSEYLNNTGLGTRWEDRFETMNRCYIKNITLWSIGEMDGSNSDLGPSRTGTLEFNADMLENEPVLMPGSITHPQTSDIYIKFSTPIQFEREAVSGTFVLGLVDPQILLVSFQYYEHELCRWSEVEHKMFSSSARVNTWRVERNAFSHIDLNTIRILFSGSTLPVDIDFLTFDIQSDDPIISTLDLFHDSHLEVHGMKHSSHSNTKMILSSFHAPETQLSVDQVSIMARKGRRAPYYKVITLHSDGRLMLYTLAELRPLMEDYPEVISEPSGVYISPNYGTISSANPVSISTARIDVETNSIYLKYTDGSSVLFRFSVVADTTTFVLYEVNLLGNYPYYSCYFSKYITERLKAVSNVVVDETKINFSKQFPLSVQGKKFYFDHEEASWLIQAGSDIIVEFP